MMLPVQFVIDAPILVDVLTGKADAPVLQLLEKIRRDEVEGWYAAHAPLLVHATLGGAGDGMSQGWSGARALFQSLKPLPQVGNEWLEVTEEATGGLELSLLQRLSGRYLPRPVLVQKEGWRLLSQGSWQMVDAAELLAAGGITAPDKQTIDFIDLRKQQRAIWPHMQTNVLNVMRHGQYIMGPEVKQLEAKLTAYTGAKHCITVSSGTEALLISLMALGIGPGDEVITTPFTFVATAEVIVLLGAKPVFVDIEPDTCNMDPGLIEAAITAKTKAIIPVSLYGQAADMDEINAIAARHGNLPVIEDAAQSFGAEYKGKKSCNLSTIGCTSFFPSKPLGCYGDGGAIFTSDDALAQACREIRVHGQSQRYVHTRIGVGGRMDTLQCAIVLAKLSRFDHEVERRKDIGARYNALLDQRGVARVQQRGDRTSVFAQYTVFVSDRQGVQAKFKEAAVPTAVHYPVPLNEQPAYRQPEALKATPVAERMARLVMSLPMGPDLDAQEQDLIIGLLTGASSNPNNGNDNL